MIDGNLTPSITGDVTGTFAFRDYDNGHYLVFTPDENETENTLTGTITLSGVDYNGTAVSDSYTVTQKPYNPYLKFIPFSEDTVNILYNETSTTFQVECQGIISLDGVYVEDSFFSNAFKDHYVSGSVIKIDDTHYTLVVNTDTNNTHTPSERGVVSATPTTEFGKNDWDNGHILGNEAFRWVRKCGIPGIINLSPAVRNVEGEAGSTYFTYSIDSYMTQPISITHSGDMNITGFAIDGSRIDVTYGENRSTVIKSETITVSGTDYQGLTITKTAVINQERLSYLEFLDTEKTIEQTESTVSFRIDDFNVSNLRFTYTGSVTITSYQFNARTGGHTLVLTTADNNERRIKTSTLTVTATDVKGNTLRTTAVLHKNGPDGIIVVNPTSLTIPKSPRLFTVNVTTGGITSDFMVTSSGDVTFSTLELDGTTLNVIANENTTEQIITGTIVLSGIDYKGKQITTSLDVTQKPYDSYIELSPETRTVNKDSGTVSYTMTTDSVDLSTLTASHTGSSITSVGISGNTVNVAYANSTVVATKSNTITISGTDIYGNSVSGSATLLQTGVDPEIWVSDMEIKNTQSEAHNAITTLGVDNLSVSFSGTVIVSSHTITKQSEGNFDLAVFTPDNDTLTIYHSVATVTGTVTEGQYEGQTRSKTFNVTKFSREGQIIVSETEYTVKKNGQTLVIDVTLNNMDNSTVTSSIGTFNSDKTQLTIPISANTTGSDKTITVTISGEDANGITRTTTITITQYGIDPYISIQPDSKSIAYDEQIATYTVVAHKTSNLEVSFEGPITIESYTLADGTLTIITGDNESTEWLISTITVTGISELGETISSTATLSKYGIGGGILITGGCTIPSNAGSLVIPYDIDKIDADSIIPIAEGDIDITKIYVDRENKVIVVDYGANEADTPITGRITVIGVDEDGLQKYAIVNLTQLGNDVVLSVTPAHNPIAYSTTSANATVTASGVSRTSLSYSGSIDTTDCTFTKDGEGGTINAQFSANSDSVEKFLYLTVSGIDYSGTTVTASSVVEQGVDPSDGVYVFMMQPASQVIKVIEASANKVYYTISSFRGNLSINYNITGFVLTGRWGSKPSVGYSNGYPYVKVPLNTHQAEREVKVIFTQDGSYNTLTARIIQQEGVEPNVTPIWKDFVNSETADSFIEYHINLDGDIIYAGKAYKYPDDEKIT